MSKENQGCPPKSNLYPFYKIKDGDDCLKKTLVVSGYTGALGTAFALMSGFTSTTVDNPALGSNMLMRLTKYSLPMFAAGAMFAASTCTVANLRGGKNDPYNHLFGGLATGSVFGTAMKSQKAGWGLGIAIGLLAMTFKIVKMEDLSSHYTTTHRREQALTAFKRGYFTTRPNPEGDQSI